MKPRWKQLLDSNDWLAISNEWMDFDDAGRRAVLEDARKIVPTKKLEDGIETLELHCSSDDVADDLKIPAELLQLGELEASLSDDPMSDAEVWYTEVRPDIEKQLHGILDTVPPEERQEPLTQAGHASVALEALAALNGVTRLAVHEVTDAEDERYIRELIGDIARHAFFAGQHSAVALWKPYEEKAATRLQQERNLRDQTHGRDQVNRERAQAANERGERARCLRDERLIERPNERPTAMARHVTRLLNKELEEPVSYKTVLAYLRRK